MARKVGFGRASEEPYRRRTSDGLRLAVALAGLIWISLRTGHVSAVQRDIFHAINDLPGSLLPAARVLNGVAAVWAASLVVAAAVLARRWRLARDLLIAGALGWMLARGLGVALDTGLHHHLRAVFRSRLTPSYPSTRVSLLSAIIFTASPYVTRVVRLLGTLTLVLLLPTELYIGTALPRDLTGALLLGWGIAAGVHLVFGSPGGRPTPAQVQLTLEDLGVTEASGVRLAPVQPPSTTLMLADHPEGELTIKVLGRDERDARLLSKIWRYISYRDSGPALFLTRTQEVEHEAFVALLARSRGAVVPQLVAVGTGGPGTTVLVQRPPRGRPLAELEDLSDELLARVWEEVAVLHRAGVVHGNLNTSRLLLDDDGSVAAIGLDGAQTPATETARAYDLAELLVTTAAVVGPERAIAAALAHGDHAALTTCLTLLQPAALSSEARRLIRRDVGSTITELRAELSSALGIPEPEVAQLRRASRTNIALTAGTLVGVVALLAQVSDPTTLIDDVRAAQPGPLAVAALASFLNAIGYAIAMAGSIRERVPLLGNLRLQVAGPFANLALPIGSQALQIRFLQKHGLDATTAVAATGLVGLGSTVGVQLAIFALSTSVSPHRLNLQLLPHGATVTVLGYAGAAVLAASLVVGVISPLRRRLLPILTRSVATVLDVARSPRQITLLVIGNVISTALTVASLALCLAAFGYTTSIWTLLSIQIATITIANLIPIPGGGTAVGSIGLSGGLIAVGIPTAPAVAVVLLNQLVGTYLPAVPGWFALRSLIHHQEV